VPLAALLYFSVTLATLRTRIRRFPFAWTLVSLSLLLAMICCRQPWGVIALLAAQAAPPWIEMRRRGRSTRVFTLHTALAIGLLAAGWALHLFVSTDSRAATVAVFMLIAGVLIRTGVAPLHCWMTDLFENATFGTALLYVTPMAGAYAAVRLVLPVAPDWALESIALLSLATALYAAGMALVQREARRFFCYLFLSNSSLALVGLEFATPIGLTGGLCVWLSVGLSLAGLGLTLRALEARTGRLSLADFHGLYEHMPRLAVFFLVTGLASIGFPGTVGFVGVELLVEGAVNVDPVVGMLVVLVTALNGIAVLHAYFRLFTGTRHTTTVSLRSRWPERFAVLVLTALILGGGLIPQPGVASRYHAAAEILAISQRSRRMPSGCGSTHLLRRMLIRCEEPPQPCELVVAGEVDRNPAAALRRLAQLDLRAQRRAQLLLERGDLLVSRAGHRPRVAVRVDDPQAVAVRRLDQLLHTLLSRSHRQPLALDPQGKLDLLPLHPQRQERFCVPG
jgi:NADH-quinone oxidoreductase subunit M